MTSEHHDAETHAVGYGTYLLVWTGLISLTALTVSLAGIDLGRWIVVFALLIATVKSLLVLNIFMHLRFEDRLFRMFVAVTVATLAIFFILTFSDYAFN
jgi:cytochrome c oxidase subunit 4